jgi:hemolysin activation/secretion protein
MSLTKKISLTTISAFVLLSSVDSFATSISSSADAGRVQGNIQQSFPETVKSAPVKVTGNAPFSAPAGSEKITFNLKDVALEGSSVYSTKEVATVYQDKLGQKISLADVYGIAANLTAMYRNDGYILTQVIVPPQTIENGMIKLTVVEGKIDQVFVDGTNLKGKEAKVINSYVSQLKSKPVLNNSDLEKTLLLINDLPGVTARSVLSPSRNVAGASDLTIQVERDATAGTIQVDNFGSKFLGMWEAIGSVNLNSLFGQNEQISAQLAYAPSDQGVEPELLYGELRASLPVGSYGTSVEANIGKSYTDPGHTLTQFDVLGKSYFAGLKLNQPIIRTRDLNLSTSLGLDKRSTETKSNIDTFKNDDLTSLRLAGNLDFVDTLFSAAVTNATVELSKGLSILGASNKGDTDLSRAAGDPQYLKLTADVSRLERLTSDFSLLVAAKGQMSNDALLSAEEFGIGGANGIGRGYDPSELVGEDGIAGSLEVRWSPGYSASWMDSYSVYGFYDVGKVWNDDGVTASQREQSLASTGAGVRMNINSATRAGFMVAVPLTRPVSAENEEDRRFYFNLSRDF